MRSYMMILAAGFMAATVGGASAATISFDGFGDNQTVDQSYGDVAGVLDVSYFHRFGTQDPQFWSNGYNGGAGDDTGVLMLSPDAETNRLRIRLDALNGNTITSFGADIGRWIAALGTEVGLTVLVNDIVVFSHDDSPNNLLESFDIAGLNATSVVFRIGNSFNAGVQQIDYTLAPVPLPATAGLLGGALLLGGLVARRRRARA